MSKKRTFLKILSAAVLALSVIMLALTAFTCILLYSSGGKTFTLFGNRYAAVEMTGDPGYPRGSLIRLQQGSIPENTPVAVDAGGIVVLSDNRLDDAAVDGKPVAISREQILGAVDWSLPWAGILFCWVQTGLGMALCLTVPALLAAGSVGALAALRPNGRLPRGKEEEPPAQAADPFPTSTTGSGPKAPPPPPTSRLWSSPRPAPPPRPSATRKGRCGFTPRGRNLCCRFRSGGGW